VPDATPTPDRIRQATAYQRTLLDALGDDDPAEAQASTPAAMRALIADAGPRLLVRPEPREWSALLCLAHIADAELVMAARYRWALAHDEPELIGYDQDLWVDRLHGDDDPEALVDGFERLRDMNLDLWRRSTAEQRQRLARHRERGPESYDLMFRMIAGHDRVHLAQARRAIEAAAG
jgi:hypothetical protein